MSRRIVIKSAVMTEQDLAEQVAAELRQQGAHALRYDAQENKFVNEQYDDVRDDAIQQAERLYYGKLRQRRKEQVAEKLKKNDYEVEVREEADGCIKIVGKQHVYAG